MIRISQLKYGAILLVISSLAGALVWARNDKPQFTARQLKHWAYKPVVKPAVPAVRNAAWVRTDVDRFILRDLEKNQLSPSAPADKMTLLRRATFDLTGLPPTPEEAAAFLADRSPKAYERVVDRLLASPHYGEKWARHWLDLARYAESEGFKADETRPNAWRYRDYVIKSFNDDKPYDRFVQEQIAGDELWPGNPDALVATAFNRHYPDESNARNLMQRRQEILNDVTDTVGAVFMATTIGCARCHDHKYDPVLQKDYYKLQAFFAAARAKDDFVLASAVEQAEHAKKMEIWRAETRELREQIEKVEAPIRKQIYLDNFEKYPEEIQLAVNTPPEKRDTMQWLMYHKASWLLGSGVDEDGNGIRSRLKGEERKRYEELRTKLAAFDPIKPRPLPIGSGITDVGCEAPAQHVMAGGAYDAPGEQVQPGFLTIIDNEPAAIRVPAHRQTTGRRSALAAWLTDPKNPLTARVMVNRLWHYHFGRGIVGTPSDFGMMRDPETHRELLDYLAAVFVEKRWSLKAMHRLIMLSNAYRQSSDYNEAAATRDPDNRLWWRFQRQRLSGEEIRDAILAVSGELNRQMSGPSVFPEIPEGMEVRGGWKKNEDPQARNRRSIYVFVRRNSRYPMFQAFDMPDTHESCGRRVITTTAPQALEMLNDKVILRAATAFAGRVLASSKADGQDWLATAWRLAYSRRVTDQELALAAEFMRKQESLIRAGMAENRSPSLPANLSAAVDPARAAALVDFCHVLFNSNEFVYVH
ncbi:MAG: DUF1549 and DUF1553 domain-containing protein [Blastocatellia bacterium]|nr:DUF1549 and DUF1553 domain-containing protein [Blastocatellia bacterium]